MIRERIQRTAAGAGIALLLASGIAQAQWVFVARHVIGRVEQMSQQSKTPTGPSYDSASVILDAASDKVWTAVVRHVRARQDLTVTQEDGAAMLIQFTNGQQIAGVKVNTMGDNLAQILVSSAHVGPQPNVANMVVDNILRVCGEMKVQCSTR